MPKSATANVNKDNLKRCVRQGKYVGIITDVYKGTYFIRLNIGVNAVAHSCNIWPSRQNVTRWDLLLPELTISLRWQKRIITRMIKRGA